MLPFLNVFTSVIVQLIAGNHTQLNAIYPATNRNNHGPFRCNVLTPSFPCFEVLVHLFPSLRLMGYSNEFWKYVMFDLSLHCYF